LFSAERTADLVALDDALTTLAGFDERKSKVIELRFFAGLSLDDTADALGVSVATIGRELRLAQAWLQRELDRTES
jgi:RNA polymerase sigma-70 factor (ECF subfamily)